MPIIWEWIRDRSLEKEIEIRHDGMTSGGAHGDVHKLDKKKPILGANFEGRGFSEAEADAVFAAALAPGATYSLTDYLGTAWSGTVKSVSETPIDGVSVKVLKLSLIDAVKT